MLLVEPGHSTSTADVSDGLRFGMEHHGVQVVRYRLDLRLEDSRKYLHVRWRRKRKADPAVEKPNDAAVVYHAGEGAIAMALRHQVDVVLVVSAMLLHPDVVILMKRAGLRVVVLFTESPYDEAQELRIAAMVDGCWTNERTSLPKFLAVNPRAGYLPHAWHPGRHFLSARSLGDIASHDVVFVGSGFPERVSWFNSIDWTGIDLGLYGTWNGLGLNEQAQACVKAEQISNEMAASLYRRAKIGLNLYRIYKGSGRTIEKVTTAESLSPRAYELAACGAFHLSQDRAEVGEVFGECVPTFSNPREASDLIRRWLADDAGRARLSSQLPACVAEASWAQRATTVIGDIQTLLAQRAA